MADLKSVANKVVSEVKEAEQEAESWWKSAKDDAKRAVVATVACVIGVMIGVMLAWSMKSDGYTASQIDQKIESLTSNVQALRGRAFGNSEAIDDLKARMVVVQQKTMTTGSVSKKKHR
jgi:hypothetical protein